MHYCILNQWKEGTIYRNGLPSFEKLHKLHAFYVSFVENEIWIYYTTCWTRHVEHETSGNTNNKEQYFQFVKTCYL